MSNQPRLDAVSACLDDPRRLAHGCPQWEYLKDSRIKLVFPPPYAQNLNPIERLWKLFKKTTLRNRHYETLGHFRIARDDFLSNSHLYRRQMRSLPTENFAILGE